MVNEVGNPRRLGKGLEAAREVFFFFLRGPWRASVFLVMAVGFRVIIRDLPSGNQTWQWWREREGERERELKISHQWSF